MLDSDEPDGRFGIQSVEVAGKILEALTEAGHAVPLRDIAKASGLHPGKVHRYLVSLTRIGLAAQQKGSGHYGIGTGAIRLGLAGLRSVSVVKAAGDVLAGLRDETDETALLSLWTAQGPVVVELEESSRPVYMNIKVGSILPLMPTATGRLFAAFLPDRNVRSLLEAEARSRRSAGYDAILDAARRDGLAEVRGTLVPSVVAISAPAFDHHGQIAAVLGILGRDEDLTAAATLGARKAVLKAAAVVSARLGHAGGGRE